MAIEKEIRASRQTLKAARRNAGMTQQRVADELGISLNYYQKIEAGDRTGDFEMWDALEDLFSIHQRELRKLDYRYDREDSR